VNDPWPLPVGFSLVPDADPVMAGWPAIHGRRDGTRVPLEGTFDELADVLNGPDSPGRLVVLGEPGTGKSTLVLRLTLDLLKHAESGGPVPVLLSAASWNPAGPLESWVASPADRGFPGAGRECPGAGRAAPDDRARTGRRAAGAADPRWPGRDGASQPGTPTWQYPWRTETAHRTYKALRFLARHLRDEQTVDLAWWRLHKAAPRTAIAVSAALMTGPLLGIAAGFAARIRAGPHAGIVAGVAAGLAGGALSGITAMRDQSAPRALNFRFTWPASAGRLSGCLAAGFLSGIACAFAFGYACARGSGLWPAVITALAVGPLAGLTMGLAFGPVPGITGGIAAAVPFGLAAGLAAHRPSGLAAGCVAGLVLMVMSWIWIGLYQPAEAAEAVHPASLLRSDRVGSLVVGLTAGAVCGVAYGLALGPEIGAGAALAFAVTVTLTCSSWGAFSIARLWLALLYGTPMGVMGLLTEAHDRGVLRQSGGHFQFRHRLMQDRLAASSASAGPRHRRPSRRS